MKQNLLLILLSLQVSFLWAQTPPPEIEPRTYIGININGLYTLSSIGNSNQKQLIVNTVPTIGYRVNRFVLGVGVNFGYNNKHYSSSYYFGSSYYSEDKSIEVSVLPMIKYYSKINIFLTATFMAGKGKTNSVTPYGSSGYGNSQYSISEIFYNLLGGNFAIGYAVKAGKSFLIEPQVSYSYGSKKSELTYPSSYFNSTYSNPVSRTITNTWIISNFFAGLGITYRL